MAPAPELRVVHGGVARVFRPGAAVSVGRHPDNDIVVDDPRVSRRHATLTVGDGGVWSFQDTSSRGSWSASGRCRLLEVRDPLAVNLGDPDGPALWLEPLVPAGAPPPTAPQQPGAPPPPGPGLPSDRPAPGDEPAGSSVFNRSILVQATVRIGRAGDNDVVLAEDLTVSRHHAEVHRRADGTALLLDLGSRHGTFVDGQRTSRAVLHEGALVRVGRTLLVWRAGQLDQYLETAATLSAHHLGVTAPGDRRLLADVSLTVAPGQLVAVVGPSGAGKSTLLRALTGQLPTSAGAVTYNGRDLGAALDEVRHRIGVVPQDDILHTQLGLREALAYAAELRFAADVDAGERQRRVDEVLDELGLSARADLRIDRLSGGQRKRASLALELLARPALLFLDEPTSGLDPGFERSVMELLRSLADSGRSVLVITHAVDSLKLCDRVLFLAPGGRTAFFGPPGEALAYFGASDYPEVFQRLERDGDAWAARFAEDPARHRYLDQRPPQPPPAPRRVAPPPPVAAVGQQFGTLLRRGRAVLTSSRTQVAMLAAQAPLIAALLLVAVGTGNLEPLNQQARSVLAMLALGAVAMGLVNASREVVREAPILRRERAVGLSVSAYLAAKAVLLGAVGAVQAVVLALLVVVPQGPPLGGALLPAVVEVAVLTALTALAAVAFGLLVSASVTSDATALVLVPILLVAQLSFMDAFLAVGDRPVLGQLAWLVPAFWGFAGTAASVDLWDLEGRCQLYQDPDLRRSPLLDLVGDVPCSELWQRTPGNVLLAATALVALTGLCLAAAWWVLDRRDPLRRPRF